ncbi:ATP-binding cassette domain-containing protein [Oerskovia sp. M15]
MRLGRSRGRERRRPRRAPGRSVAIVGPSGVGKTTLLMTAAGLVPQLAGSVSLDGSPIASLTPDDVAHQVVFVAEDGHVFDTTLLENLRVARGDVTPRRARPPWSTWDSASGSPGFRRVRTILGPDATTISGGERRRLLIARALLAPLPCCSSTNPPSTSTRRPPTSCSRTWSRPAARTGAASWWRRTGCRPSPRSTRCCCWAGPTTPTPRARDRARAWHPRRAART